jgi:HK97 family phage portal protein
VSIWRRITWPFRSASNAVRPDDPIRWWQWVAAQQPAGVPITNDSALELSVVWACVMAIVDAIAPSPWNIYDQKHDARLEIVPYDDPMMYLLNTRPNADMTAIGLKETLLIGALTWGNGYAEIQRDNSQRIAALWPLLPHRTFPRRDADDVLYYEHFQMDGSRVMIPAADVFHVHGPGITGLMGDNLVARAAKSMSLAAAQERFASTYFGNNTLIGGFLEFPGKLDEPAYRRLKQDWEDRYKGPDKSNRPAILEGGMKFTPVTNDAQKAQLVESRQFQLEEICRWFRVPPHKVQHLLRSTNNNIEHQGIEFTRDACTPWARRFEQEGDYKFFNRRRPRKTLIDLAWLTQGDAKTRAETNKIYREAGVLNANEIRQREGLNPIKGKDGDVYIVAGNMSTIEKLTAPEPAPVAPGGGAPPAPGKKPAPTEAQAAADTTETQAAADMADLKPRRASYGDVIQESLVQLFGGPLDRYSRRLANREADLRRRKLPDAQVRTNLAEERERLRPVLVDECAGAIHVLEAAYPGTARLNPIFDALDSIDNGTDPRVAATRLVSEFTTTAAPKEQAA